MANMTKEIQDLRVFSSVSSLRRDIELQLDKFDDQSITTQYMGILRVDEKAWRDLETARDEGMFSKAIRVQYDSLEEVMIIKLMPSCILECCHRMLSEREMKDIITAMGANKRSLLSVGSARFEAPHSSKEGDSSFIPKPRNPMTDWPSIVFEAGISESLPRLRIDAGWWLDSSNGDVKTVILIAVKRSAPSIILERWERVEVDQQGTKTMIPQQMQELFITPEAVHGAPLVLKFENVFLRPPIAPETDIIFTSSILEEWASYLWEMC